jgi:N-formylmaleamate deformylase
MKTILTATLLMSTAWATSPPRSFAVEVTGKGRPMILIPGLASSGKTWDTTVAHYKDKYECHVLTLAGFAGQPPIQSDSFLQTVRDDIISYIRDNKLQKPVIVGHSLGGFVALWIAEQAPGLVGPLVIVDSLPFLGGITSDTATAESVKPIADQIRKMYAGPNAEQAAKMSELQIRSMVTKDADFETIKGWGRTSDGATVGEAMAELFTTDIRSGIPEIQSSTLVMGTWIGYKDYTTRDKVKANFDSQYAGLARLDFVMFDNARHFIMLDDGDGFFRTMDGFLKKQ